MRVYTIAHVDARCTRTDTRVCVSSRDEFPRAFLRAPRNCSDFSTELPPRRWPRGWRNFSGFLAAREIGHEKEVGGGGWKKGRERSRERERGGAKGIFRREKYTGRRADGKATKRTVTELTVHYSRDTI